MLMLNPSIMELGYDLSFEIDEFSRPRLIGEGELVKNLLLTVLFMEPKNYPSLPHIGMSIRNLLYNNYNTLVEKDLEEIVIKQCPVLDTYFENGMIQFQKTIYQDKPSIMIFIDISMNDPYINPVDNMDELNKFFIGISFDKLGKMTYDISNHWGGE